MNQKTIPGIVLIACLLACAVGFTALPKLQTARRAARTQSSVHLERARRLLNEFNHRIAQKSVLLDQLSNAEVDVDIENVQELIETSADLYQATHSDQWKAYPPSDYALPDPPSTARAGYGNLAGQITEGLRARDAILADNERLLTEAMASIDSALNVQSGDVSGRSFAESNRLQGVILYNQGLCERIKAVSVRRSARRQSQTLAAQAARAAILRQAIAEFDKDPSDDLDTGMTKRISDLSDALSDLTRQEREAEAQAAMLNARLGDTRNRAMAALAKMESIKKEGVNFDSPNGGSEFAEALLRQDRLFREADAEVAALQFGHFPNAQIDLSGDLLHGNYLENGSPENLTTEFGVAHFRDLLASITAKTEDYAEILDQLRADRDQLAATKASHEARKNRLAAELAATTQNAADGHQRLLDLETEAAELEDHAIALLDKAKASFRQAAASAASWVQDGRTQAQSISPEAQQGSASTRRAESGWMTGHITAQQADCDLAKAWIHRNRFVAYRRLAKLYASAKDALALDEADAADKAAESTEAHDAAVAAIESAVSAIQKGYRDAGKHWTFVAQAAAANDLLSLLGHPEYAADAIEAYRNVVKARETKPYAQKYVKRLAELEAS